MTISQLPNSQSKQQHIVPHPVMPFGNSNLWRQLYSAENDDEFYSVWLSLQCLLIGCVESAAIFLADENGTFSTTLTYPADFSPGSDFVTLAERAGQERKGIVQKNKRHEKRMLPERSFLHLAYPVVDEGTVGIVIILVLPDQLAAATEGAMRQLQWGASWLLQRLQAQRFKAQIDTTESRNIRFQDVLELTALAIEQENHKGAALSVTTGLADRLNCDRLSLGFREKQRVRLCAISHSSKFNEQMNLSRSLEALMDECLDQGVTLIYPQPSTENNIIVYRHEEYSRKHGGVQVVSVPFVNVDTFPDGVFVLERAGGQVFTSDEVILAEAVAALVGPVISEKKRNDRPILEKIVEACRGTVSGIIGPGGMMAKISMACAVLLVLFFAFAKGDYKVAADMTLEGTVQRVVIAPFDGFLDEASPRAGDLVKKDQVLARLDSRDLVLERLRYSSQRQQYRLEYHRAIAENQVASARIIREQIEQAGAQISLLDEQIGRATIRAPFDGLIIRGDLSQTIGIPLLRGQILFEVAPLDSYRVVLAVNEKDIDQVRAGQLGHFVVNALPGSSFAFEVESVIPVSVTGKGENVFRVDGRLEELADSLRPGMQGYARIAIDRRKLIWIWSHELVNLMRLWLWSHLP
jgi:multidrug resistance efflux pump